MEKFLELLSQKAETFVLYAQLYMLRFELFVDMNPYFLSFIFAFISFLIFFIIAWRYSKKNFELRKELLDLSFKWLWVSLLAAFIKDKNKNLKKKNESLENTLKQVREKRDASYRKHREKISRQEKYLLAYRLANMSWTWDDKKALFEESFAKFNKMKIWKLKEIEKVFFDQWIKDHVSSQKYWKKSKKICKK